MRDYLKLTDSIRRQGRYRQFRQVEPLSGREVIVDGRRLLQFCGNDYLDLAHDPRRRQAMRDALERGAAGAAASRYITGNHPSFTRLETMTAAWRGKPACLVFSTGYMANLGVISALGREGDVIFSDARNHASMIDGCRLSRARTVVFPHRDYAALERLLETTPCAGERLILTESLFSISGTEADLVRLARLKTRYAATWIVDDAHAGGCCGPGGAGLPMEAGVNEEVDVVIGTYSKALAGLGGFAVAGADCIEYLRNVSRPSIFTTALPASVVAGNLCALEIVNGEWQNRQAILRRNADIFRQRLAASGWPVPEGRRHVFALPVGADAAAPHCQSVLMDKGFLAWGIRPPTVPEGEACLRVNVTAAHTAADLDGLAAALATLRTLSA